MDRDNDALGARKTIMEKLTKKYEVEEVSQKKLSKVKTNIDVNNVRWNKVDIFLKSNEELKSWKETNFRKKIFSKCYLWETFEDFEGEVSRLICL